MRWLPFGSVSALVFFVSGAGCAERRASGPQAPLEAPAPSAGPTAPNPAALPSATPSVSPPVASTEPAPSALPSAAPQETGEVALGSAEPPLTAPDGKTLPQTEERPRVDSPAFKRRIEQLAQAIIKDDPSLCSTSFFPLLAYKEVKAVEKPERDYQYRLLRHFERDIHEYHKALGSDAGSAKFDGAEVPEPSARWMKPGSEGNRLGYFRVLRSHLRFIKPNGKPQNFELTSMISWRGEWYVVHLHGFE